MAEPEVILNARIHFAKVLRTAIHPLLSGSEKDGFCIDDGTAQWLISAVSSGLEAENHRSNYLPRVFSP
jgi:hypothetical protein